VMEKEEVREDRGGMLTPPYSVVTLKFGGFGGEGRGREASATSLYVRAVRTLRACVCV
jgi:hypothetical protein